MACVESSVSFPATNQEVHTAAPLTPLKRPPHLPFRRISLPSAPSGLNRLSVASFESLPEEQVMPNAPPTPSRRTRNRPTPSATPVAKRGNSRRRNSNVDGVREEKRRKVIFEIRDSERKYFESLQLVNELFLQPLVEAIEAESPILERPQLNSIFGNFAEIWGVHHALSRALDEVLDTEEARRSPPHLSSVLGKYFPYLSMYTSFFVTYETSSNALATLVSSTPAFATFLRKQEAHPRCERLRLQDHLLTVVQRCPRYLLLVEKLIDCTDPEDEEMEALKKLHALTSKITAGLNDYLHTHSQTLALLSIQRATPNLPFPLLAPGRTFLKRGTLLQVDRDERLREFILFSDCIIWLSKGGEREWTITTPTSDVFGRQQPIRPALGFRSRSKSEAELPLWKSSYSVSSSGSEGPEDKWWYRGRAELMDVEVVIRPVPAPGEERRFEFLSPENSFAVYAPTEEERDQWTTAIRNAKASLLASLHVMRPDSTLTSSSSNYHLRRALQALPYSPSEAMTDRRERRGKVDHFVPAIWVPDGKASACMRCGNAFGWRRRRHHCRLCGRCVCGNCSNKTFFISDPNSKQSKPARACAACYEAVFPLIELQTGPLTTINSFGTITSFPSSQSMPSLALPQITTPGTEVPNNSRSIMITPLREQESPPSAFTRLGRVGRSRPPSLSQLSSYTSSTTGSATTPTSDPGELLSASVTTMSPASSMVDPAFRNSNRFSLANVALHTQPVTTRPSIEGEARSRRFSLVLGGKSNFQKKERVGLEKGVAAGKLNELLGRKKDSS